MPDLGTIEAMNLKAAVARLSKLSEHNDALAEHVVDLKTRNEDLSSRNEDLASRNESLQIKITKLVRALRGRQSEKLDPSALLDGIREHLSQEDLALLGELDPPETPKDDEAEYELVRRKKPSKKLSPEGLPLQEHEIPVPSEERACEACGEEMPVIGHDGLVRYGYKPLVLYAALYHLEKRACSCGKGIVTAKAPSHPIPRCKAEPDLLAQIIVAKHVDALPLYRQSKIFERQGLAIGDTTLGEWCRQVADVLAPVENELRKQVLAESYLQVDETGLRVQAKGGCDQGWLWAYGRPHDQMFFDYRKSRSRDGPNEVLADFSGTMQNDGYAVYGGLSVAGPLVLVACWAHVRRKFFEAQGQSKKRAGKVLKLIQKLYRIERAAREGRFSAAERCAHREEHARPLLEEIRKTLDTYAAEPGYLPKSPLGKAGAYTLRLWERLERYVEHGEVEIDNNLIENAMRLVAVARKNFLFAGSEAGAERAALFFSLMESCRRLEINPHEYLTDVLTRLPMTVPEEIGTLTPKGWKQAREQGIATN